MPGGMGGSSQNTQTSQQQSGMTEFLQNQSQQNNVMQSATQNPWAASIPTIQALLSKLNPLIASSGVNDNQQQGIDQLVANAKSGNPFANGIDSYANEMLAGGGANAQAGRVTSAFDNLNTRLSPQADANYSSLNDPKLRAALDQIQSDVGTSINGQFAAAGRDMSGANQMAYGRGVSAAQTPLILDQFNKDRAAQREAANTLYSAGNTTSGLLSAMGQQALVNKGQGVSAAGSALDARGWGASQLLQAGGLSQSIPTQALGLLAQIGLPIAGLGTTSSGGQSTNINSSVSNRGTSQMSGTGTSNTEKQMSPIEMIMGLASAFGSLKGK